jgi:hypothetical protein
MDLLPQEIVRHIYEFNQDPDQLIILHHGKPVINRNSFRIREIGAIQYMKKYYRLHTDITSFKNKNLYDHGKNHYINHNHYLK